MKKFKILLLLAVAVFLFCGINIAKAENAKPSDEVLAASDPAYNHHPWRVPGGIVVDFKDKTNMEEIEKLERELGIDLNFISDHTRDIRLMRTIVDEFNVDSLLGELNKNEHVEYAEPDYYLHIYHENPEDAQSLKAAPNDPMYKYQWNFEKIGVRDAWDVTRGKGVVVAVIDTGVAYKATGSFIRVEDLEKTGFVKGYNFVDRNENAFDDHAHGTHVSGTIAQSTNNGKGVAGIAYEAKIMPLKVLSANGYGKTSDIADAVRYAADNGAQVINMSLGGPFPSIALKSACSYAWKKGVVIVCAAGNSRSKYPGYPAGYKECLSVSSTRYDDKLAPYSNRGGSIDIAAPGGDTTVDQNGDGKPDGILQNTIQVKNPSKEGYYFFQGTSMACPHVAAVAAMVISTGVNSNKEVVEILKKTARKKNLPLEEGYGAGIVDAKAAVNYSTGARGWVKLIIAVVVLIIVILLFGSVFFRRVRYSPMFYVGILLGIGGLFFLPALLNIHKFPGMGLLSKGFSQWGSLIFGAGHGASPVFYSILIPLVLCLLFYKTRLEKLAAGLTLGVAADLIYYLFNGINLRWISGVFLLDKIWLIVNILAGILLAYLIIIPGKDAENKDV